MTREELAMQVMRLESSWGTPSNRTPEQFSIMCEEWFRALGRYGSKTVAAAVSHAIDHHKFGWTGSGPLPEIVSFCTRDDREWRDIVELKTPALPAPSEKFERDGRTTEEEIAFREQEIAAIKKNTGYRSHEQIAKDEMASRPISSASQSTAVSEALLNTKVVRKLKAVNGDMFNTHENQFSDSLAGVEPSGGLRQRKEG